MGVLLSILFALLACLLGGLYYLGAFRQRRPREPPLDRGPIPWLGHALEFRRDMPTFLKRMKQEHGDIFTVQLGGFYYTFLMDPLSFGAVFKEPRTLDFRKYARQLIYRMFGYETPDYEHDFSHSKYLMGDELSLLTQAMMNHLQDLMLHSLGDDEQTDWVEDELFTYSYNMVFRAGYLALFGNETPQGSGSGGLEKAKETDRLESNALFHEFRKYDQLFPKMLFGGASPSEKREAESLLEVFRTRLSVQKLKARDNISGWVRNQQQLKEEHGMKESMQARHTFLLLWAVQGNTGPSAFWLLCYLLKHPKAMKAVKAEVEEVLRETGQEVKRGGPLIDLTRDMLMRTPVLDSAVEETFRLTGTILIHRSVLQDMTLKMEDGREYALREGDRVALFPYTAVQTDPEVYPDPLSFKYDRFLNPDGSRKTDFYKAGKKLKYYSVPWGAGVSMCPGRFVATNELKLFVFLMLTYFELELKRPDEEIPGFDVQRWGFGAIHPSRDIQFRYRLRL